MKMSLPVTIHTTKCARDALTIVESLAKEQPQQAVSVFVTGSLHLVGSVLSVVDADSFN